MSALRWIHGIAAVMVFAVCLGHAAAEDSAADPGFPPDPSLYIRDPGKVADTLPKPAEPITARQVKQVGQVPKILPVQKDMIDMAPSPSDRPSTPSTIPTPAGQPADTLPAPAGQGCASCDAAQGGFREFETGPYFEGEFGGSCDCESCRTGRHSHGYGAYGGEMGMGCDECDGGMCDSCVRGSSLDNVYVFMAGDAWRNELDIIGNSNFGFKFGANWGIPLSDSGIGFQIGASYGAYDLHGRFIGHPAGIESQGFMTFGFFKRANVNCGECWSWAAVYDRQWDKNAGFFGEENISLGQLRGLVGYALSDCHEIGIWTSFGVGSNERAGNHGDQITTIDQFNFYYRTYWGGGAESMVYLGLAEDPADVVFGFNGNVPVSSDWAMFGSVHYMNPSAGAGHVHGTTNQDVVTGGFGFAQETWSVTFGFVWYPHCNAHGDSCGRNWMPLLPVADNGSFALEAGNLDFRD